MGLRIHSNVPSLIALRNLRLTDVRQQRTLERLSTGNRITRPQDDPFGLSLSESLRSRIRGLEQASSNASTAGNLASVADQALTGIVELLHEIRGAVVFAMNRTGSSAQIAAEQDAVDSAVQAIRRIAETTNFAKVPLLDGQSGFRVENVSAAGILEVRPIRVRFNPVVDPTPFSVTVTASATQAGLLVGSTAGGEVSVLVTGPKGSQVVNLGDGMSSAAVASAIGGARGYTGVYASGAMLFTETFGTSENLRLEILQGPGTMGGQGAGTVLFDQGSDVVASMQGMRISGHGRVIGLDSPLFRGEIEFQPGASGAYTFEIRKSGMLFQLGDETTAANQERIGIPNMAPDDLGKPVYAVGGADFGGFLSTITTGEANDLFKNPGRALAILDLALEDVGMARSALGAFVADVVEPASRVIDVTVENLTAADSAIRDADFAEEIANLTHSQVLFESGIAVLGQTNRIPQAVLELLAG
jgi:flagellin